MNKFKKYCPNVFVAECEQEYKKGDLIDVTTKYGKEAQCEVFNLLGTKNGLFYYSIVRVDQESYAKRKAEKYENLAEKSEQKSNEWYEKAQEERDFLALAEPIKVGHHSEKRHRALIDRNWNRMGNSVKASEKAQEYQDIANYWKSRENDIDLSMPESLEFFSYKLEEAQKYHAGLKDGSIPKEHSYSIAYANKAVKDLSEKVKTAKFLWGNKEQTTTEGIK